MRKNVGGNKWPFAKCLKLMKLFITIKMSSVFDFKTSRHCNDFIVQSVLHKVFVIIALKKFSMSFSVLSSCHIHTNRLINIFQLCTIFSTHVIQLSIIFLFLWTERVLGLILKPLFVKSELVRSDDIFRSLLQTMPYKNKEILFILSFFRS